MKNIQVLLLIITSIILFSCGVRKSEVSKQSSKAESNIVSNEEKNKTENTNIEISKESSTSSDGSIITNTITVSPIDTSKPAEFTNKAGQKIILNNAKYTEQEKKKSIKKNNKENVTTKIYHKKESNVVASKKEKLKSSIISKDKVTKSKDYSSLWLFIPFALFAAGYLYYKTTPYHKLFNIFKKT